VEERLRKQLEALFSGGKEVNYRSGQIIVRAGELPQKVFWIKSGLIRIYSLMEDGKELTLSMMGPGLFFSMPWVLNAAPSRYYFEAISQATLLYLPRKIFLDFLDRHQELFKELIKFCLLTQEGLIMRVEFLIFGKASHKVAAAIFLACQYFNHTQTNEKISLQLPLSHRLIASFASLSRETTSLEMKQLAKKGIIFYKRRLLTINNLERLKEESKLFFADENLY